MRKRIGRIILISATWVLCGTASFAQDVGAITNGDWSDGTIWTTGTAPGSSNNVYIGSNYPSGSASTVTVTVSLSESAGNLYVGDSGGDVGTLDLTGGVLTVSKT